MPEKSHGYRVLAPTGDAATDTAAFVAWANASPRPKLWLSPKTGQKLVLQSNAGVVSGDYWIEGNGVEIVHKHAAGAALYVVRAMTTPQDTVTAVDNVDFDVSGTITHPTLVTRVTLTTAANVVNYPIGSFALLASEDVAPHASAGEAGRMGQVMRVAALDSTSGYVYFASTVWREDLYTTTMTLTGMPAGETYINNVKLSVEAGAGETLDNRTWPVIWLQNCYNARVSNVQIVESCSTGITLSRVVGGSVENCNIRKIRFGTDEGAPTNGRFGYGIFMTACESVTIRDNYMTNCRHGMTDNWTNGSAAGTPQRHGPNVNCLITGNKVSFPRGAGIDLHSSALANLIVGNHVNGARNDNSGGGYGYQIRGEGNVMIGNSDYGCDNGIQVFENTIDGTQDAVIIGHHSRAKKYGIVFSGHASSTRKLNAVVQGGVFETEQVGSSAATVVLAERAKVNFRGTVFRPRGQNGGSVFTVSSNGNTDLSGSIVYDPHAAAGSWALLSTAGSGNTFAVTAQRDADDGAGADAAYSVTDLSPDVILFATTLTADRAVTFSCSGRKRVVIKRTAAGAFNLNVTHSGGTLALAQNRGAVFEVHGALVMLVSPTITLA